MKRFTSFLMFAFLSASAYGQAVPAVSLPKLAPIQCSSLVAGSCTYPVVYSGTTGVMMASDTGPGSGIGATITDSLGNVWQRDACAIIGAWDCFWHTNFKSYGVNDTINLSVGGSHTFLFLYNDVWSFTGKSSGASYLAPSPFADCPTDGTCPYTWTGLVDAEPGEMMIAVSDSHIAAHYGYFPTAGFGFDIEAADHTFAIEDMIAPKKGIYMASVFWNNPDGSETGGSHWGAVVAVYTKDKP